MITINTGISVEKQCREPKHPLNEVKNAKEIFDLNITTKVYSNSPDFVQTLSMLCDKHNREYELILDGENVGHDLNKVFSDFNKSLDLQNELIN